MRPDQQLMLDWALCVFLAGVVAFAAAAAGVMWYALRARRLAWEQYERERERGRGAGYCHIEPTEPWAKK